MENVAGRVWLYPENPDGNAVQPSVTVIADEAGSVVVDAGHSPAHARQVQQEIARLGLPPPRWLVYTHHHWDHTWGACAWPDVHIVASRVAVELLAVEAARPWSHDYLREQVQANPLLTPSFRARAAAMTTFTDFGIRLPDVTVETTLDVIAGVTVRHIGGRHAPDSVVVEVTDSRVLILGDSYYPPPYHLRTPEDGLDTELLRSLRDDARFEWYLESHGRPWQPGRPGDPLR